MATERTFAMIKPDAVKRGLAADILARIHKAGFRIVAIKSLSMSKTEAEGFYAVHKSRPFFGELTDIHVLRQSHCNRPRSRRRHRKMARHHGRHRSSESRPGHHPQRTRRQHRRKLHRTAPTPPKPPPSKSAISSPATNCSKWHRLSSLCDSVFLRAFGNRTRIHAACSKQA